MDQTPWILIAIAVVLIILGVMAIIVKKKIKTPPDYYVFFWIGLIWMIIGLPSISYGDYTFNGLFALGFIFFITGLVNKNKWKQNHRTWNNLTPLEKKFKTVVMIILGILVIAGLILWFLTDKTLI